MAAHWRVQESTPKRDPSSLEMGSAWMFNIIH
jgi:hypothetical protein